MVAGSSGAPWGDDAGKSGGVEAAFGHQAEQDRRGEHGSDETRPATPEISARHSAASASPVADCGGTAARSLVGAAAPSRVSRS
jgi:hypothetical protein